MPKGSFYAMIADPMFGDRFLMHGVIMPGMMRAAALSGMSDDDVLARRIDAISRQMAAKVAAYDDRHGNRLIAATEFDGVRPRWTAEDIAALVEGFDAMCRATVEHRRAGGAVPEPDPAGLLPAWMQSDVKRLRAAGIVITPEVPTRTDALFQVGMVSTSPIPTGTVFAAGDDVEALFRVGLDAAKAHRRRQDPRSSAAARPGRDPVIRAAVDRVNAGARLPLPERPPIRVDIDDVFALFDGNHALGAGIQLPAMAAIAQLANDGDRPARTREIWRHAVRRLVACNHRSDHRLLGPGWTDADSESLTGNLEIFWRGVDFLSGGATDRRLTETGSIADDALDSLFSPQVAAALALLRGMGWRLEPVDDIDALFRLTRKSHGSRDIRTIAVGDDPDYMVWRHCGFALEDVQPTSSGARRAVIERHYPKIADVVVDLGMKPIAASPAANDAVGSFAISPERQQALIDSLALAPGSRPTLIGTMPPGLVDAVLAADVKTVTLIAMDRQEAARLIDLWRDQPRVLVGVGQKTIAAVFASIAAHDAVMRRHGAGAGLADPLLVIDRVRPGASLGQALDETLDGFHNMFGSPRNAVMLLRLPPADSAAAHAAIGRVHAAAAAMGSGLIRVDDGYDLVVTNGPSLADRHAPGRDGDIQEPPAPAA